MCGCPPELEDVLVLVYEKKLSTLQPMVPLLGQAMQSQRVTVTKDDTTSVEGAGGKGEIEARVAPAAR